VSARAALRALELGLLDGNLFRPLTVFIMDWT
jgi:hypothetical protein